MMRVVVAVVAVCLGAFSVLAASPKIESAIKTFKAVAADAGKLKTYCAMTSAMDSAGEKEDKALAAKISGYMKQLGTDFVAAWNAGEGVDDNSADGKAYVAAIDELSDKCPQPQQKK